MAKYDVTYSCGHTDTVNLTGPRSQREYMIWRYSNDLCPDCYRKKLDEENRMAAQEAKEMELPALSGSEKQISWAETIRVSFVKMIDEMAEPYMENADDSAPNYYDMLMKYRQHILESKTRARDWIDERDELQSRFPLFHRARKWYSVQGARQDQEFAARESSNAAMDAKAEATIRPAEIRHEGIVEIRASEEAVRALYQKDDDFRKIVKELKYSWNADRQAWELTKDYSTGDMSERAAELTNALLIAGFVVCLLDQSARDMVKSGSWNPRGDRWISFNARQGVYMINHNKDEDLYAASRRLTGSRWSSELRRVTVPKDNVNELCDFAELNGFKISAGAKEAMAEIRALLEKAVVVAGEKRTVEYEDKLSGILDSSREVLEDLKDGE